MREIKFRAWDGEKMLKNVSFSNIRGKKNYIVDLPDPYDVATFKDGYLLDGVKVYDHYAPKLMQFTGLKDKNGVEIYEGDVVQISSPKHPNSPQGSGAERKVVSFIEERAMFGLGEDAIVSLGNWIEQLSVIGNIHKNPELNKSK